MKLFVRYLNARKSLKQLGSRGKCDQMFFIFRVRILRRAIIITQISMLTLVSGFSMASTLEELLLLAVQNSPEIKRQNLLVEASKAELSRSKWAHFPTPYIDAETAEVSSNDTNYMGDDYEVSLGFVQPLWSGGANTNTVKLAQTNLALSEIEVAKTQQDITLRALSAYADWLAAAKRVKVWREGLRVHETLSQQVQRRATGGVSSESDLSLAQARTALTEAELFSAIAQERVALTRLKELVYQPLPTDDLFEKHAHPKVIVNDTDALIKKARDNSPDVLAAAFEIDVAEAEANLLRSENYPELDLRVERQYGDISNANSEPSNRVFVEFSTRFGAGLSGASAVKAARLRKEAAEFTVETERRAIDAALTADLALKDSLEQSITVLKQSKSLTSSVYESFERQFLAGSRTWLDVLNSVREIIQLDLRMADTQSSLVLVSWRVSVLTEGVTSVLPQSRAKVSP